MYDELLKFAVQLAKAAGGIQLAYFRGDRLSRSRPNPTSTTW